MVQSGTGGGLYNLNANYSFNYTPDFVVKIAMEPGWGHWELFGIDRNFRDRIYPTSGSPYNATATGAGIGGGFRAPLATKKVTIGLKGLGVRASAATAPPPLPTSPCARMQPSLPFTASPLSAQSS